jgi:hypothetical protein
MSEVTLANIIDEWPLDRMIPYARDPRTQSDARIAQIVTGIADLGFSNPILVESKAGIIAAHAQLPAGRKLKLSEVAGTVFNFERSAFGR